MMRFALLAVALAGLTVGAQIGPVTVTLVAVVLVAGFVFGYVSALHENT